MFFARFNSGWERGKSIKLMLGVIVLVVWLVTIGSAQAIDSVPGTTVGFELARPELQIDPDPFIIDHNSVDQFDQIPDHYIEAASNIPMLFRHASVGNNISNGLNCLQNYFPENDDPYFRLPWCDRELSPDEVFFDEKYDRSNWIFEYHRPLPNQNPGWYNKIGDFVDRVNGLSGGESYDVVGFKFGFVDGVDGSAQDISVMFFNDNPNDNMNGVLDLEALELAHPDKLVVWWTMGLALGIGSNTSTSFNQQMRDYVQANGKVTMDFADIMSHRPDGTPCYNEFEQNGLEAMCDDYTNEDGPGGGHLNGFGGRRMAKAVWVMMARLAGWNPDSPTPGLVVWPGLVAVDEGSTNLTVIGTGFTNDSTVLWDDTELPTTYVNDTRLEASVSSAVIGTTPRSVSIEVSGSDLLPATLLVMASIDRIYLPLLLK